MWANVLSKFGGNKIPIKGTMSLQTTLIGGLVMDILKQYVCANWTANHVAESKSVLCGENAQYISIIDQCPNKRVNTVSWQIKRDTLQSW